MALFFGVFNVVHIKPCTLRIFNDYMLTQSPFMSLKHTYFSCIKKKLHIIFVLRICS